MSEYEPPRSSAVQYATGKSMEIALERIKRLSPRAKDVQFWMHLVVKLEANAVKNNVAHKHGMLSP